eukprot:11998110-Prorocentrum_lima.AAC.1
MRPCMPRASHNRSGSPPCSLAATVSPHHLVEGQGHQLIFLSLCLCRPGLLLSCDFASASSC